MGLKKDKYAIACLIELNCGKTIQLKGLGQNVGVLRRPSVEELNKYFAAAGMGRYDPKVHWCGLFQVYLLKQAGVNCHWAREIVDDSGGADLEIVRGDAARNDLQMLDIVRIHREEHHFTVLQPATGGFLGNFEGNAGGIKPDKFGQVNPLIACNWAANMTKNVVEDVYVRYRIIG